MAAALDNIRVVDLTQGLSGPLCTRNLAHMGAEVIKIERPDGGDMTRYWDTIVNGHCSGFVFTNANKRSAAINLKTEQGQDIIRKLAADADVFVENYVPGTVAKWGLDYDSIRALNPKIVYCSISGYGQEGPYAKRSAYDLIIQGESGLILTNGTEQEYSKVSLSICDIAAAMYATTAVLSALYYREKHQKGQYIDIAMFDCIMNWMGYFPYMYWYKNELPKRVGIQHHTMAPYGPYLAGDGEYIIVAGGAGGQPLWIKFCETINRPAMIDDPRFTSNETRLQNRDVLDPQITAALSEQDSDYWVEALHKAGIPCGKMNDLAGALNHPQAIYRKLYTEIPSSLGPVKMVDYPVHMSEAEHKWQYGPPTLGEHTEEVLLSMGYTEKQIQGMKKEGIIGT